jgi:cytochrome oxidase Cu insertion factor (SCO1/SenC/PrrC family)
MKRNWPLWTGFLLTLVAFFTYFFVFARFPITRDVPWVNLILYVVAIALLIAGLRRAFATPSLARKIISTIVALLGTAITAFFVFYVFVFSRQLPPSTHAPAVGQKAPHFTLPDVDGKPVSLAQLVSNSPNGVLLVFYRGFW